MTMNSIHLAHPEQTRTDASDADLVRIARTTGGLYLAFFVLGIVGSLVVPAQIVVDGDPQGTLSHLVEHESLARIGVALDLGIALIQALVAVWFYRLFRRVDSFAAGSLALFGTVNAVAILTGAAMVATALDVAEDSSLAVADGAAPTAQLLYAAHDNLWGVAGVFFGLWLLPMGWLVLRSGWMPRLLGWLLIVGGGGYVLSALGTTLFPEAEVVTQLLTVPATLGELWMVGFLIAVGVRRAGAPGSGGLTREELAE